MCMHILWCKKNGLADVSRHEWPGCNEKGIIYSKKSIGNSCCLKYICLFVSQQQKKLAWDFLLFSSVALTTLWKKVSRIRKEIRLVIYFTWMTINNISVFNWSPYSWLKDQYLPTIWSVNISKLQKYMLIHSWNEFRRGYQLCYHLLRNR